MEVGLTNADEKEERFMSNGLVVATGSGSSALLKSIQDTSMDQVERVANLLKTSNKLKDSDLKRQFKDLTQAQLDKLNSDPEFSPEARHLSYLHREPTTTSSNVSHKRGSCQRLTLRTDVEQTIACVDASETVLPRGSLLQVGLADSSRDLLAVVFRQ